MPSKKLAGKEKRIQFLYILLFNFSLICTTRQVIKTEQTLLVDGGKIVNNQSIDIINQKKLYALTT